MLRGKTPLILAAILGLLAGILSWTAIRQKEKEIKEGWALKTVVVAQRDIVEGSVVEYDMLGKRQIPEQFVTDSVVLPDNVQYIVGQKVAAPLKAGDTILWSHFQQASTFERLSNVIEKSVRAISVTVSEPSAVGGFVRPNDHIDVIGSFRDPETREMVAVTLLQNVIVLATGKITGNTNINLLDARDREYGTVTLMVLPEQAEILALAQEMGQLYLSLRHSEDMSTQEERGRATIQTLLTGNRLDDLDKRRKETIQIIRGNVPGAEAARKNLR